MSYPTHTFEISLNQGLPPQRPQHRLEVPSKDLRVWLKICTAGVTQVLVYLSICQGSVLDPYFQPHPYVVFY